MDPMAQAKSFLPTYRLITGYDDSTFCYRVSEALEMGYSLYGNPTITIKEGQGYVAQALIWESSEPTPSV